MTTLIRLDQFPAAERLERLREFANQVWVPMELHALHDADYEAQLRPSGCGTIRVVLMDLLPLRVRRTPRLIRQAQPDMLKAVMPVRVPGSFVIAQGGRQARLAPGDFAFYDTRRPYEGVCGADLHEITQALTFMFPRSLLPLPPRDLERLTAVRICASDGVGALTSQFLRQLACGIDHYSPAEAVRLSTTALELLATRLARELDANGMVPPETHRHALLTRIHVFIQQHLGNAELAPPMIAAAHHISVRYLHRLFAEQGTTVSGWIRERRMEYCRRDLSDPAQASRPVAAIAAAWGFSNATYFSRAFRAAHGMPPREYRRSALGSSEIVRS